MKSQITTAIFLLIFLSGTAWGQDAYHAASSFPANSETANAQFRFDYLMTGSLNAPSTGRKTLLMYLNSADGSWAVDENSAWVAGFTPVRGNRRFLFAIGYADGNRRSYTEGKDAPEDKQYTGSTPGGTGPLLEMRAEGRIDFKEFVRSAVALDTEPHPVFGSQKLYEGKIMGETVRMKITDEEVNIPINAELMGLFCGVFKDHFRQKNRLITYFKGPAFSLELENLIKGPAQFDGRGFEGRDVESSLDPEALKNFSLEEIKAFEAERNRISETKELIMKTYPCTEGTDASLEACRRNRDRMLAEQDELMKELMSKIPGNPLRMGEDTTLKDCFTCEQGTGHQTVRIRGCILGRDGRIQITTTWPKDPSNPDKDVVELFDYLEEYKQVLLEEGFTCD